MAEFVKDSLTLEETNKVRISLGLKPLTDDSASSSKAESEAPKDKDQLAQENYQKHLDQEAKKKEDEEIRQRIAKAQNRRELRRQLRGPTLGEADPNDEAGPSDSKATLKWLKQAQKKAKENAARRAKEIEEQEQAAASSAASYSEADLAGLRVAHDVDDFDLQAGEEGRILTLRDSKILDNDDDELMDAMLEQKDLDRRNEQRKKGPKQYTGLEEQDESDALFLGAKKGILSKYDADIPESSRTRDSDAGFTLGGSVETTEQRREKKQLELEEEARRRNRSLLNLDYSKNQEVSDYLAPGEVGFKKTKTKKKKRPAAVKISLDQDEEDSKPSVITGAQDVEMEPIVHTRRAVDNRDNLADDDELAASLAQARRSRARKVISKMTPEQIARNLAAQKAAEEAEEKRHNGEATEMADVNMTQSSTAEPSGGATETGMTFDETSEFIRNIGNRPSSPEQTAERRRQRRGAGDSNQSLFIKSEPSEQTLPPSTIEADSLLQPSLSASVKEEDMEEGEDVEDSAGFAPSPPRVSVSKSPEVELGTAAEASTGHGMAGTLNMLRSQGLLESMTPEQRERERSQQSYDLWKNKRLAEEKLREQERQMSKLQGSAKDQATREYENRKRELEEARRAEERFRDYRPDVEIKYHDQYGRELNNHEAWKLLSHTFHGKMPGRAKQEKYRRKVEEERRREKLAAGDSNDMSKAFRERQARQGQAHMVLSVGARGNAPQDFADSLGPNLVPKVSDASTASNGQTKGKDKSVAAARTGAESGGSASPYVDTASAGLRSLPLGYESVSQGSASPSGAGVSGGQTGTSVAPKMRPAFQPVSDSGSGASLNGSAPSGSGFKLSFGTKRKADAQNGESQKRR